MPRPRVDSALLRLRRTGPGGVRGRRGRGPRRLRPPPQVAGRARSSYAAPGSLRARADALEELGLPADARAEALSPAEFVRFAELLARSEASHEPDELPGTMLAPAKLNLCLYLGPRREDGLHELCSLFEPLALADELRLTEARAGRGRLRGRRGPEPGGAGARRAARARLGRPAAADRDREADPGRRRARRRQRRRRRGPAPRARARSRDLRAIAAGLGRRRSLAARARAPAWSAGRGR